MTPHQHNQLPGWIRIAALQRRQVSGHKAIFKGGKLDPKFLDLAWWGCAR